jgi:hypothetical protein
MKITIETIPHGEQRYPTCGDWVWESNGDLTIKVSAMGDWRYEAAVGIHEAVEALLCKQDGVSQAAVDQFDIGYDGGDGEPGNDPEAPYHEQHCAATEVEKMLIEGLGLSWDVYDAAVEAL